jgi:capsular polysaccharide biosynthesis protein
MRRYANRWVPRQARPRLQISDARGRRPSSNNAERTQGRRDQGSRDPSDDGRMITRGLPKVGLPAILRGGEGVGALSERAVWGIRAAWPHRRIVRVVPFLHLVRRRVWMLAPPVMFALLAALLLMHWQKPSYQATSVVLASRPGVVPVLPFLVQPPRHPRVFMRTQALLARSPELAARVVAAAGVPGMSPGKLLAASVVIPAADSDLLRFSVSDADSRNAILFANTYASEFARYKTERDGAVVKSAIRSLTVKIASLKARGGTTAPVYSTLIQQRAQLKTIGRLLSPQVTVLQTAGSRLRVSDAQSE